MNIAQIMTPHVVTVGMDDSVRRVRELFKEHRFHHLLVASAGRLVGVISDRDLLRNLSPFVDKIVERTQDLATLERRVHQIMTRRLVTVAPQTPVEEAARLMLDASVSCLPVVNDAGRPIGILSWRDLVRGVFDIPVNAVEQ